MAYQQSDGGGLWVQGDELAHQSMAETIEQLIDITHGSDSDKWKKSRRAYFKTANVADCLRWARDIPEFYADSADFNRLPQSIAVSNGAVVDLKKGATREGTARDKFSWSLADGVIPGGVADESPLWNEFVWESLAAYPEDSRPLVCDWLKRFFGYCLTAATKEEVFLFLYGPPGTGKSTLLETVAWIMNDYVVSLSGERLASNYPQHRQWIARLQGKRLAIVTELPPGGRWNPELAALVSGETTEAHYMRQNSFDFRPVCKVVVAGNHKPKCDPGSGLWRRMRLVDFSSKPTKPDTALKGKLRTQSEGVLQWLLNGAANYYKKGLQDTPEVIKDATDEYRKDEDSAVDFFEDCLERAPAAEVGFPELYMSFRGWAVEQGLKPWTKKHLGMELKRHGFNAKRGTAGRKYYTGIKVVQQLPIM